MGEETTAATDTKKSRPRSPSYPGIDLKTAIAKAKVLFDNEGRHAAHADVIYGHWGHKPNSGAGGVTFAALKRFGLLMDQGSGDSRRGQLTSAALTILHDEENSPERAEAIRAAALRPAIHAEVWTKYEGSLPSSQNLRLWLIRDKGFTAGGAEEFISQLRRTVAFAGLGPSDRVPEDTGPREEERPNMASTATSRPPADRRAEAPYVAPPPAPLATRATRGRTIQLPLGGEWATLDAPFPLTEESWTLMLSVLNAMKPGLVTRHDEGEDDQG